MSSNCSAIVPLHQLGKRNCESARKLCIACSLVSRAIKRFKELGNKSDRHERGRKRTVNSSNNRKIIKKRVERNSRVSMRKIARETGINRESVRLIAKKELGLKPYKLQKCQLLTDENKKVRLERCRMLQRRAAGTGWEKIVFTDEKLFTVEQAYNRQNDRSWSKEASGSLSVVEHRQNPRSVMVWGGICASGKPLICVD